MKQSYETTKSICSVLLVLFCLLQPYAPSASPLPLRFIEAGAMRDLDCLESWEQLCSPALSPERELYIRFSVYPDRVTASPFMDDTELVFDIIGRDNACLTLRVKSAGGVERSDGASAGLFLNREEAVYMGPHPRLLLQGKREQVKISLVNEAEYGKRHADLSRRYIPGGRCEGMTIFTRSVQPKRCINRDDSGKEKR